MATPTRGEIRTTVALIIGALAGFLSGLFGVGGGILIVPALLIVAKIDPRLASGTSLAAVLPITTVSMFTYWYHHHIDWTVVPWLAIGAMVGSFNGTWLLQRVSLTFLSRAFLVFLVVVAIRLFIPVGASGRGPVTATMAIGLVLVGVFAGTLSGLFGIGGGVVMVPFLVVGFDVIPVLAKGSSVAVTILSSLVGTVRNRRNDNANLALAATMAGTGVMFAALGGTISASLTKTQSNISFAILLVVIAAKLANDLRHD